MRTDPPELERMLEEADRRYGLFPEGETIAVGVSGGSDSMALLHGLIRLSRRRDFNVLVLHLHHGLRGPEADDDARFVCLVSERLGVPYVVGHADVGAEARSKGLSLEMAAREARYRFFREMREQHGFLKVALAHTADDQVETVLLKLLRGAGPRGLAGMAVQAEVFGVPVVRPLLAVTRRGVESYLHSLGERWREDRSNQDRTILRNRIRHELLPMLERRYNPAIRDVCLRMARIFQEEERWLDGITERALKRAGCDRLESDRLANMPLALRRRVWRLWLQRAGVPESVLDYGLIERMESRMGQRGGSGVIEVGGGWGLRISYGMWELIPPEGEEALTRPLPAFPIRVPGETVISDWGICVRVLPARGYPDPIEPGLGRFPCRVYVNRAKLRAGRGALLFLRGWRPGDRIAVGEGCTKKLQDVWTDARIPRPVRSRIPLLVRGDSILWIAGGPPAYDWRVASSRAASWSLEMERLSKESVASREGGGVK